MFYSIVIKLWCQCDIQIFVKTVSSLKLNKDKDKKLDVLPEWGMGGGVGFGKNLDPGVESDEDEDDFANDDLMIRHPRHSELLHSRWVPPAVMIEWHEETDITVDCHLHHFV